VRPRRWRGVVAGALAAAAGAGARVGGRKAVFHARHTAETAVGAFQKLELPDGSVAQLNTDSAGRRPLLADGTQRAARAR